MKALALCSILFWGLLQCGAQLPNQLTDPQYFIPKVNVDPIFTSILLEGAPNYFQTDIVSDGEGHHYVTVKDGRVTYYLLDNKGNTVRSYSGFPANSSHPAITSYYHAQGLVTRQHVVLQNGTNLELYRSTNGGGNWSFVDSRSIFGNLVGTDAFEDNKGVHIAYGSDGTGGGVRYHLRRRSPDEWAVEFPDYVTTSVSTTTYNTPSIVASTESVHVYFGGTVSDPRGLYSMAFNSPAWALKGLNFHRRPGTAIVYSNKLGVFPWYHVAGSCNQCLAFDYRNLLNAPDWTETVINPSVEGLDYGWKPHAVGYGSQGYLAYSSIVAPYQTRYYTIGGTHIPINFGATGSAPVVGANASGVDVIWKTTSGVNTGKATFRRRPIGVQGTLQGDHSFTDTNWVIGTAIVPSGSDLRLKDASVTFVWGQHNGGGPGKLSISAGASLVLEGNAKLILESPTQTGTQGGQLELPSGYAFVIPSSAQLIAKAGSKITFGSGASLVSYGKVMMSGSAARKVELIGTPNWSGMSLSGSGSSGSKLEYVKISGVTSTGGSALLINNSTNDTVRYCNISNNSGIFTNGVSLAFAGSPDISFDTLKANGGYGIVFQSTNGNFYGNVVKYNNKMGGTYQGGGVKCASASPLFGRLGFPAYQGNNTIKGNSPTDSSHGVAAYTGSYPYVGSASSSYYGYNDIDSVLRRVYANGSDVMAEQCWWGSSSPSPAWFVTSNGTIGWQPYLSTDPTTMGPGVATSQDGDSVRIAMDYRASGDYPEAQRILRSIISAAPASMEARRAASVALHLFRDTHDPALYGLVRNVWTQHWQGDGLFTLIVGKMLIEQRQSQEAVDILNAVAQSNSGTDIERNALLDIYYL